MTTFSDTAATVHDTTGVLAEFRAEMAKLRAESDETRRNMTGLERSLSGGLKRAITDLTVEGKSLGDVLRNMAQSMAARAFDAAVDPIANAIAKSVGGAVGSFLPFAHGGVLSQGRVMPFAKGGVVGGPMTFPMAGGTGLMGEAGPEAIMPLTRGADGRLGVAAQGGTPAVQITMNIQTPDVTGFQRSQSQIAASMQRALTRGARNT